jgi:hypothetical protein
MLLPHDWLDDKVAVFNLHQVAITECSPRFLLSRLLDQITNEAVLLLKVLIPE